MKGKTSHDFFAFVLVCRSFSVDVFIAQHLKRTQLLCMLSSPHLQISFCNDDLFYPILRSCLMDWLPYFTVRNGPVLTGPTAHTLGLPHISEPSLLLENKPLTLVLPSPDFFLSSCHCECKSLSTSNMKTCLITGCNRG